MHVVARTVSIEVVVGEVAEIATTMHNFGGTMSLSFAPSVFKGEHQALLCALAADL